MYYLEVITVQGPCSVRTFYGSFPTKDARDEYGEILKQREISSFENLDTLEANGVVSEKEARELRRITSPSRAKHIPHDGHLPVGEWKEFPTEDEGVSCWYNEEEMLKFLEDDARNRGFGDKA
ncbi:MAG: hypothetical protein ABSA74_01935 [Candidatus Staskawiczbacteria bacterium]|jgi:hypothetical protein